MLTVSRYTRALERDDNGTALINFSSTDIYPDYVSPNVETYLSPDPARGRGVRARHSLPARQLILIESPLASSNADLMKDKAASFTFDKNRTVNDASQSLLESHIVHRVSAITI